MALTSFSSTVEAMMEILGDPAREWCELGVGHEVGNGGCRLHFSSCSSRARIEYHKEFNRQDFSQTSEDAQNYNITNYSSITRL